uniref:Uncharacterized protein n=1 Tax=Panagrolaimus superbus TaxID=310955 RepID=A0A914Z6A2_9BILA
MVCYYLRTKTVSSQNDIILMDKSAFNKYEILHKNPLCPALTKEEWKIYKELTTPEVFVLPDERPRLSWKDMALITFTSKNHMPESLENCASIQQHPQLKTLPLTVFFSSDVTDNQTVIFEVACPQANIIIFPFQTFSLNVQTMMDHYRFKAIYQVLALKKHKIILSFDSSVLINKNANFTGFIESNIKSNPTDVTLLTSANHNMFTTVHPKMYPCFPNIKSETMINVPQFQSGLILWIGTEMGWKAMRRFVECSLQPSCIAPPGATKLCNYNHIYKRPKLFSGCHRYDQSAINLILYETSNQKPQLYGKKSPLFRVSRKRV